MYVGCDKNFKSTFRIRFTFTHFESFENKLKYASRFRLVRLSKDGDDLRLDKRISIHAFVSVLPFTALSSATMANQQHLHTWKRSSKPKQKRGNI